MIHSTIIYFAMIIIQALLQIVLLPLQTHYLLPSQYGELATVIACTVVLSPLFNLGLQGAAARFMVDFKKDSPERHSLGSTLLYLSFCGGFLIGSIITLGFYFLSPHFELNFIPTKLLMVVLIHCIAMGSVLVGSELLRMESQPKAYAQAMTLMSLSYLIMSILFITVFHWGLNGALCAYALMPWAGLLSISLSQQKYKIGILNVKQISELLIYSTKLIPHFTFTALNTVADRLILALILGGYFTGIYTAGTTVASVMLMISSAILFSARPYIFLHFAQNSASAFLEIRDLSIFAILIIAIAGSNLALWSPEAILLLTSSAYQNAWQMTILLTLKYMLQGMSALILTAVLFNKVKVHRLLWVSISSILLLVVLASQLAPTYELWGVAVAGLIASIIELICNIHLSKKATAFQWPIKKMLGLLILFFFPACGLIVITQELNLTIWQNICIKLIYSLFTLIFLSLILYKQFIERAGLQNGDEFSASANQSP
jgi:O-antigen/teichoic acid export membrane protein